MHRGSRPYSDRDQLDTRAFILGARRGWKVSPRNEPSCVFLDVEHLIRLGLDQAKGRVRPGCWGHDGCGSAHLEVGAAKARRLRVAIGSFDRVNCLYKTCTVSHSASRWRPSDAEARATCSGIVVGFRRRAPFVLAYCSAVLEWFLSIVGVGVSHPH